MTSVFEVFFIVRVWSARSANLREQKALDSQAGTVSGLGSSTV